MAADARLLMRAAAAESSSEGIKDRFANYHPKTRALRCTACDYLTIKHESLWPSHAASKSHRSNIARIRREEEEAIEAERAKVESSSQPSVDTTSSGNKRKGEANDHDAGPSDGETQKRTRTAGDSHQRQQEEEPVDAEWERFQREVLNATPAAEAAPPLSAYADATIEVAPALKAGVNGADLEDGEGEEEEEEEEEKTESTAKKAETEAEKRIRLEREDREEIIARLEEEQRLQDEADERVSALRSRFERLKQARANKKK